MDDIIDTLKIEIDGDSEKAVNSITKLIEKLEKIRSSAEGGNKPLSTLSRTISKLDSVLNGVKSENIAKLKALSEGLGGLSGVGEISISSKTADMITRIGAAVDSLKNIDMSKLNELASGLASLSAVGNANIPNIGNASRRTTGSNVAGGAVRSGTYAVAANVTRRIDAANEKLSDTGEHLDEVSEKTSEISEKTSRISGKLSNIVTMFKRRIMYRAMNAVISLITQGFKDGTDAVYQYSKAMDGRLAKSMDRITTSAAYVKASLGAAAAPVINILAPALEYLSDVLVTVSNAANMVFSSLSGADTWTRAVKVTTEYASAADSATEANKRLQNSIMGFDELNIISDTSSGKNNSFPYKFEEVPMNEKTVAGLKVLGSVVLALAGAKIASSVIDTFKSADNFVARIGKVGVNAVNGVMTSFITGFKETGSIGGAVVSVFKNGWNHANKLYSSMSALTKGLFGTAGLIAGFRLAADAGSKFAKAMSSDTKSGLGGSLLELVGGVAVGVAGGAMIGGPIGAAIGGAVALAGALTGAIVESAKLRAEAAKAKNDAIMFAQLGVSFESIRSELDKSLSSIDDYTDRQKALAESISASRDSADKAKSKLSELFYFLDTRNEISSEDVDNLRTAFDELYTAVDTINTNRFEMVANNISEALKRGLEPANTALSALRGQFLELQQSFKIDYTNLSTEASSILTQLSGGNLSDQQVSEYKNRLKEIQEEMSVYSFEVSAEDVALREAYGRINIGENEKEAVDNLKSLQTQMSERLDSIGNAEAESIANLETLREIASMRGIDTGIDWDAALQAARDSAQAQREDVINAYYDAFKSLSDEIDARKQETVDSIIQQWQDSMNAGRFWEVDMKDFRSPLGSAKEKVEKEYKDTTEALEDTLESLSKIAEKYNYNIATYTLGGSASGVLQAALLGAQIAEATAKTAEATAKTAEAASGSVGIGAKKNQTLAAYGSGGFPESGQLFIAREAGAEMVGSIGGRAAVANNDQIVEGIKQGVFEAMQASGGSRGSDFEVKVYLDGKQITAAVEKRQRERGATIYPGGVLSGV